METETVLFLQNHLEFVRQPMGAEVFRNNFIPVIHYFH